MLDSVGKFNFFSLQVSQLFYFVFPYFRCEQRTHSVTPYTVSKTDKRGLSECVSHVRLWRFVLHKRNVLYSSCIALSSSTLIVTHSGTIQTCLCSPSAGTSLVHNSRKLQQSQQSVLSWQDGFTRLTNLHWLHRYCPNMFFENCKLNLILSMLYFRGTMQK